MVCCQLHENNAVCPLHGACASKGSACQSPHGLPISSMCGTICKIDKRAVNFVGIL